MILDRQNGLLGYRHVQHEQSTRGSLPPQSAEKNTAPSLLHRDVGIDPLRSLWCSSNMPIFHLNKNNDKHEHSSKGYRTPAMCELQKA